MMIIIMLLFPSLTTVNTTIDSVPLLVPKDVNAFTASHANSRFLPCNLTRANYFNAKYPAREDQQDDRLDTPSPSCPLVAQ